MGRDHLKELLANPEVPAIFEAAFEHKGVIVKTDILQHRKENRWRLVEVKSTADLKDHHLAVSAGFGEDAQCVERTRLIQGFFDVACHTTNSSFSFPSPTSHRHVISSGRFGSVNGGSKSVRATQGKPFIVSI